MRIVQLANFNNRHPGSFVPMLRTVKDASVRRGWGFEAIFTEGAENRPWYAELEARGAALRSAPNGGRVRVTRWLEQILAESPGPVVLHTHFTRFDLPAAAAKRRRSDAVVVWHLHSRFGSNIEAQVRNVLKLAVVGRRVDAIVCVSEDLAAAARRRLAPGSRVVVLPNAIDVERFRPVTVEERKAARRALSVADGVPLLLHFGWDWQIKGGELFLATVAVLAHDGVKVEAISVGAGEQARSASVRMGIADRVRILPPRDDVRTLYAAADVLVSSSPAEGMPFAVLECLCSGTPVVASAIPVHATLARQTDACVIADRDPRCFADAVQSVLSPTCERRRTPDTSKLAQDFDLNTWGQRIVDLYSDLIRSNETS
jgi:glycosyltransferase involved in cell wall biosynthesis